MLYAVQALPPKPQPHQNIILHLGMHLNKISLILKENITMHHKAVSLRN